MEELVKSIHRKWLDTKRYAANKCRRSFPEVARQLDECAMFSGEESLTQLAELIYTPQGREFMLANHFPTLSTFRKFKPLNPEQFKVYIDSGKITLHDPGKCFLIGNTEAEIICRETQKNDIVLMHGARANVYGYDYAVLNVEKDRKSKADVYTQGNALLV